MKATFRGGVHPAHGSKAQTQGLATRSFVSDTVRIIMNMNIGAPSQPCVAKGDHVKIGQVIGEPVGFLGLPVHASVSGEVVSVEPIPYLSEQPAMCVTIHNDFADEWVELHPLGSVETVDPALIIPAIKNAGICGLGGASFPTHVKLSIKPEQKCDCIIANGAECETHLTCDHRLMLENPVRVVDGLRAAMRAINVKEGIIAIEDNKPDAIEAMRKACQGREGVRVQVLKTKYPQGGEKQLIEAVTGRQVPSGKLPADAGCCIFNLNTTCAIYRAVYEGMPVVNKIVTVSGSGVIEPKNIECRIGTPITKLFDACGGLKDETYKLIMGGPMMGLAQYDVDVTVGKGTGAMLAFADKEEQYVEDPQCIRCGKCVGVCPIRLEPVFMYKYLMKGDVDTWQNVLHGMDCIECGACTYTCPARLPLTHAFRLGKQEVNNARMAAKAKAEAEAKAAAEKKEA